MFEWDVIPGERIGPLRLGMTEDEIIAAWAAVPRSAKADLIMHETMPPQIGTQYDDSGRCIRIDIRLDLPAPITLRGVDLRDRSADGIDAILAELGQPTWCYGSVDVVSAGIGACKWERDDVHYITLEVTCRNP
jgi:hypothetical protein